GPMIGTTLGHYRILHLLGRGGMGEVYAAEDLTLGRRVALKVLSPDLVSGPAERDRFAREARAIAALNHPGIVQVYSFEDASGTSFLTMELVEGRPLTERVVPQGLPAGELLDVGIQIAEAVAAAHEKGVIHRDLKPQNVLVTKDKQIKVLDFGLAKLRIPESTLQDDLPTQPLTGEGRIVGTVAYMSPEQAEGRPVDERSDIFSLGVMLYELATGQRPFQGDTTLSVLSALMKDTPRSAVDVNPALPAPIARVLKTCLQKDPERRYQSVKDLRNELRTIREELASGELAAPVVPAARRAFPAAWLVGAAVVVLAAAGVAWVLSRPAGPAPPLSVRHVQVTVAPGPEFTPAVSPDGRWVAYASAVAGNADIYLQAVGGQTVINLTADSEAADYDPAFSPDGERIAFRSERGGGGLFVMGRTGEAPRRITSDGFAPAWSPDGEEIVYATDRTTDPASRVSVSGLRIVRVDTGEVRVLLEADGMNPDWSPNGRFIAYWGYGTDSAVRDRDLWVMPAAGSAPWRVTADAAIDWCPQWSADGRYLYFASDRGGSMNLWRLPMDPDTGRGAGVPEALTTPSPYVANPRASRAGGLIAYASTTTRRNVHRAAFDPATLRVGPPEPVTTGSRRWYSVSPSPDGEHLALSSSQPQEDIFISRADGSDLRQLTTDEAFDRFPEWSPDGSLIAFYSNRTGQYEIWTTDREGRHRQVTDAPDYTAIYPRWGPDGTRMSFTDINQAATVLFDPRRPWSEQTPEVLPMPPLPTPAALLTPHWSPDGRHIAGVANGTAMMYDLAARTWARVGTGIAFWLPDGRLALLGAGEMSVFDPAAGTTSPVTFAGPPPTWGAFTVRVTRD
ncbi:MAG TPA: protein kinase, partial [Methylomirabilota bacterium]|nr:protein kinase [Methylomirabilota bacterium]